MTKQTGVKVKLIGEDGNVFFITGSVRKALRREGKNAEADAYSEAVKACHSYDEVLQLTMRTVEVE